MARVSDALINGGYLSNSTNIALDLEYGGQFGWSPNYKEWVSNQAYVSTPVICILLEAPKIFQNFPNSEKWVGALKALFELHAKSIDGLNATLTVETQDHPFGGAGEIQEEVTDVKRERSSLRFEFIEKYGRPIQRLLDYWIRYGLKDPETKYALANTLSNGPEDMLADQYTATALFIQPDVMHKRVDKAWLCTNIFPKGTGDITAKRDLTTGGEILTLSIDFATLSQTGVGVELFAQNVLDNINILGADPHFRASFTDKISADVEAIDKGYKQRAEEVRPDGVTTL
jgi:hypothetical protein